MNSLDDNRKEWIGLLQQRTSESDRDWWITFWLSLLLGPFGADRFYLGSALLGLGKLFTLGGFGLWWIIDLVLLLSDQIRDDAGCLVKRPDGGSRGKSATTGA